MVGGEGEGEGARRGRKLARTASSHQRKEVFRPKVWQEVAQPASIKAHHCQVRGEPPSCSRGLQEGHVNSKKVFTHTSSQLQCVQRGSLHTKSAEGRGQAHGR